MWKWIGCCEAIYTKDAWYLHVISLCTLCHRLFKLKAFLWLSGWQSLLDFFPLLCRLLPQALSLVQISGKGAKWRQRRTREECRTGCPEVLLRGLAAYLPFTVGAGGSSLSPNSNTM